MSPALSQSSGDLTADRRAEYARGYAQGGDFVAACDLVRQALELVPGHLPFLVLLAGWTEKAGDAQGAAGLWRDVLAADPVDAFGAELQLARLGAALTPPAAPSAYVESLFDDYAPRFDKALVERLAYRAPDLLFESLAGPGAPLHFRHAVDLGCGTGLMGERLRAVTSFLEGIDISAGMLAAAEAKGIYDRLEKGDIALLPVDAPVADLVIAADVLIYCGDLAPVLSAAAARLEPRGLLAFTVETIPGDFDWQLRASLRYAHSQAYVRRALEAAGFEAVRIGNAVLRRDGAEEIAGLVVVARRAGTGKDEKAELAASEDVPFLYHRP